MKTLYFTGTGNSLYLAKQIGGELLSIPQLIKEGNYNIEDDVVGFVVPCYYYTLPRLVEKYIRKVNIKADYIFLILNNGGGGVVAAMTIIENLFKEKGFTHYYLNKIVMVDNFLPCYDMVYEKKVKNNQLLEHEIKEIKKDIHNKIEFNIDEPINDYQNLPEYNLNELHMDKVDEYYTIDVNSCNGCGICLKVCPVGNIKLENNIPSFLHYCEWCMSCIHNCPQRAIHIKNEINNERFINSDISLNEIIKSNEQ